MRQCVVLPVRVGHKTAEPVSLEFRRFYLEVAKQFAADVVDFTTDVIQTIPVPADIGGTQSLVVMRDRLATKRPEFVIIDLANSMRSILPSYAVLTAIVETLRNAEQANAPFQPHYIFLLVSQLWDADPAAEAVKALVDDGRASLIADDGTLLGAAPADGYFDAEDFMAALRSARIPPLQLLRQKLVRQHGHFKRHREGLPDRCVQYFYDGQYCTNELTQLIVDYLSRSRGGSKERDILVHAPESRWLRGAAEAVGNKLGLPVRQVNLDEDGMGIGGDVSDAPLVLVPMCDTGQTCRKLIQALTALNPKCAPSVLAVLSTVGIDEEDSKRVVEVSGATYEVGFLLKVDQPHVDSTACRQCRIGLPQSNLDYMAANECEVPTFAMWSMILEVGLRAEADVPPNQVRPSLGLVPHFPSLVAKNGPYLAAKLHSELNKMKGKLPRYPIVVSPDEEGARAFADALTTVFRYTIVRVPRPILSTWNGEVTETVGASEWFIQLSSLQGRNDRSEVIVLDEFNASGTTRVALKRLVNSFGLSVRCYVSLFDFNPELAAAMDARVYSLYSLNWLEGESSALDRALGSRQ
ncbi:MAG: phosphoribosyltransferase [Alphaproteobacteria bacterium]